MAPVAAMMEHRDGWPSAPNGVMDSERDTVEMKQEVLVDAADEDSSLSNSSGEQREFEPAEDIQTEKGTRDSPSQHTVSLLDRSKLTDILQEAKLPVESGHLDVFYRALHKQRYPTLQNFLATEQLRAPSSPVFSDTASTCSCSVNSYDTGYSNISSRKSRQIAPYLLDFLSSSAHNFETTVSSVVSTQNSKSGNATNLHIALHDGLTIETLLMRYTEDDERHASVSLASQVGCSQPTLYSSHEPFQRNLTSSEIIEQVVHATRVLVHESGWDPNSLHWIQNVTFMGTGEPLDNYDNVLQACRELSNRKLWGLSRGRITISTVGITPRVYDLTRDLPDAILAVRLHSPRQLLRSAIVPAAKEYPLDGLLEAMDNHTNSGTEGTKKRTNVMVEYILVEGKTSSFKRAHELGQLFHDRNVVVNLVPFTRTYRKDKHKCPTLKDMKHFQSIVKSYGTLCNIRLSMCTEFSAAEKRLVIKSPRKKKSKHRHTWHSPRDVVALPNTIEEDSVEEESKPDFEAELEQLKQERAAREAAVNRRTKIVTVAAVSVAVVGCMLLSSRRFKVF